jgi:hypothetical protein
LRTGNTVLKQYFCISRKAAKAQRSVVAALREKLKIDNSELKMQDLNLTNRKSNFVNRQ